MIDALIVGIEAIGLTSAEEAANTEEEGTLTTTFDYIDLTIT